MRRNKAILAIQDKESLRLLRANLRAAGYEVATAPSGRQILNVFRDHPGDLLIAGETLPDMTGLELIKRLRIESDAPAVIMGREEGSAGAVAALKAGADDFLAYPYSTDEFLARVSALMRRAVREEAREEDREKKIGALTIDLSQRQVIVKGKATPLTPTEYKLFVYMAERPDQVISHDELLAHVWGADFGNHVHYLRVVAGRLRKKIEEDPALPAYLVTCSGVGYMLQDKINRY